MTGDVDGGALSHCRVRTQASNPPPTPSPHLTLQRGEHSPVDDARAALYIYHKHRAAWEAWIKAGRPKAGATAAAAALASGAPTAVAVAAAARQVSAAEAQCALAQLAAHAEMADL